LRRLTADGSVPVCSACLYRDNPGPELLNQASLAFPDNHDLSIRLALLKCRDLRSFYSAVSIAFAIDISGTSGTRSATAALE
jgi:hypothetical protein